MTSVAFACGVMVLAGCSQTESTTAADPAATTATATDTTSTTATSPAATDAATTTTTTASTGTMPAQCEAYMTRVQQCVDRLGANNPGAASLRQSLDANRASWSQISDQAALANACTQADNMWSMTSSNFGC